MKMIRVDQAINNTDNGGLWADVDADYTMPSTATYDLGK